MRGVSVDERFSKINMDVKRKFVFVGSSIIAFPALIILYVHYQAEVTFGYYVNTLFILVFLIVLIGLYILFNIFDNVFSFAESSMKELTEQASQSNIELTAIKDVANKAFQLNIINSSLLWIGMTSAEKKIERWGANHTNQIMRI